MATSEILGLFTTPEQYQLAQQQAQQAQAIQYANLNPMAQANYGTFLAGQRLGGAIGGALGGEDPQLKLISMRQQLASQLDPSKPESFMQAAELAARSGDQQFAIGLADAGRKAAIQIAQANKERQLAVPADIQKAQMIPQIQDAIDQYSALPPSPERDRAIKLLQNQLRVLGGDANTKLAVPIQVANRIGEINRTLRTLKPEDPTYQDLIAERDQLQKSEKIPDAIQIARRVFELETQLSPDTGVVLPPEVRAGLEAELTNLKKQGKERNITFGAEAERKSKSMFGKPYADLTSEESEKVDKAVEASEQAKAKSGATIVSNTTGGISIDTGAAAKAAGKIVGENAANIESQYSLKTGIGDALKLIDKGIYAGAYGPEKGFVAKFSGGMIGDPKKVQNTEVFMANIGEIVIPRLQQFGGNDSNEELKYLQKVVAGDQRLEPESMKRILESAEKKIQNNIARLRKQAESAGKGGNLPLEPMQPPLLPPKVTKRLNPKTGKLEPVVGE